MLFEKEAHKFFSEHAGSTCAFGYGHPDKGFIPGNNHACHYGFICPISATEAYSSLYCYKASDVEMTKRYFDYILGRTSPWRDALKGLEILYQENGEPLAFKVDTDVPCLTLWNLCLACRVPRECDYRLRAWIDLQDNGGFGVIETTYLTSLLGMVDGEYMISGYGDHGSPFHGFYSSYTRLRDKTPNDPGTLFNAGTNGYKCNLIWYSNKKALAPEYVQGKLSAAPVYKGAFKAFNVEYNRAKLDILQGKDLYKVLRDWKEEWGTR